MVVSETELNHRAVFLVVIKPVVVEVNHRLLKDFRRVFLALVRELLLN